MPIKATTSSILRPPVSAIIVHVGVGNKQTGTQGIKKPHQRDPIEIRVLLLEILADPASCLLVHDIRALNPSVPPGADVLDDWYTGAWLWVTVNFMQIVVAPSWTAQTPSSTFVGCIAALTSRVCRTCVRWTSTDPSVRAAAGCRSTAQSCNALIVLTDRSAIAIDKGIYRVMVAVACPTPVGAVLAIRVPAIASTIASCDANGACTCTYAS